MPDVVIVHAPTGDYTDVTCGVQFARGKATTAKPAPDAPADEQRAFTHLMEWFADHDYRVEDPEEGG
jgi:hypothetical protein